MYIVIAGNRLEAIYKSRAAASRLVHKLAALPIRWSAGCEPRAINSVYFIPHNEVEAAILARAQGRAEWDNWGMTEPFE